MENKEINDATSSRRLRPPVYPRSPTTTSVAPAGNSHHQHYSRRRSFQHKPAAAASHFPSQAGPGCEAYQLPPSPLSRTAHALAGGAGVGGISNPISQDTVPGSGCAAGSPSHQAPPPSLLPQMTHALGGDSGGVVDGSGSSARDASHGALPGFSCYKMPPPSSLAPMALDPVPTLGGGVYGSGSSSGNTTPRFATFLSSLDLQASVVGLTPFSSPFDLQASSSFSPPPLLTRSMASVDFGSTEEEYVLPPLPHSLVGPAPVGAAPVYIPLVDDDDDSGNKVIPYVDLDCTGGGLNSFVSTSNKAPCPPPPSPSLSLQAPAPADSWLKKEAVDWSSWGTSQLGNNTIASGGSSSAWMPQLPYSSGNSGSNGTTQSPWTLTLSSSVPAPAANLGLGVKKEAVDWSWHTSTQRRKNIITSGGSSSTWMPQPYSSATKGPMVFGSKPNQLLPSLGTGWGSTAAGSSSSQYKAPLVADFADGLFTQKDIDKIKADKGLAAIVLTDPKRVRSILNNRRSAESSKLRRRMYVSDLERKVELLQQEKKSLSAQVHSLQSSTISLRAEKNELMMKLHGLEQKTQLMNAMNETLNAEVCRLKLAAGEIRGSDVSRSSYQEMSPQIMQHEQLPMQNHQLAQFPQEQEQLADLRKFLMK